MTDHKPLVGLMNSKALVDIANPRLLRLKEKMLPYRFVVRYLQGKRNYAADFLSRYPAMRAAPDAADSVLDEEVEAAVAAATIAALDLGDRVTLDEEDILVAAQDDPTYQLLLAKVTEDTWHDCKSQEMACLRPYFNVKDRLGTTGGIVTYSFDENHLRLVIPESMRQQMASKLHAGHQGLDSMLRRARQTIYWPGMEGDLQHTRNMCGTCDIHAPAQPPEPLRMTPPP